MKAILICPSPAPAVRLLSENLPLAAMPLLGQSLVEYWLSHLACSGARSVVILSKDRTEQIRALAGEGERWGLEVKVLVESRDLRPAQALLRYSPEPSPSPASNAVAVLDHFPDLAQHPLFTSYADWFAALQAWMPRALTPDRVGVRQVQPGIWVGLRSRISRTAQLRPPCWVGRGVFIGARAILGPHTVVEDGAFIEPGAELVRTCVQPNTFVGRLARVANGVVCGNLLFDWQTASAVRVSGQFLFSAMRKPRQRRGAGWLAHWQEWCSRNKEELGPLGKSLLAHREG